MLTESLLLLLRALALMLSFSGLCAAVRERLKISRWIASYFVACVIIVMLMLSGMAGFLSVGFWIVYFVGFAGGAYAWILKRRKPDWAMLALLAGFAAWLAWRFLPCPIHHTDDVSHWGLVARYLLENDAFPDGSATIVKFQAYPLGSASFIYYIARTLGSAEGFWMLAQQLLMGLAFLPLMAHIRGNRRWLYPLVPVVYAFLFMRSHVTEGLQVDWLLSFMAFGAIASIAHYRDDLKKAIWVTVPFLAAIVFVKTSGMFFALCAIVALLAVARRCGCPRSRRIAVALSCVAVFSGAYLLWSLHVRAAFPAGLESKHAFSLTAYAAELSSKGAGLILSIASQMLKLLVKPGLHQLGSGAVFVGITAVLTLGCLLIPGQKAQLPRVFRAIFGCVAMYACWYISLFFMYLVSMPAGEASHLASINRYTSTGLTFMVQLGFLLLFAFFGREDLVLSKAIRCVYLAGAVCCAVVLFICLPHSNMAEKLFSRQTGLVPVRRRLTLAQDELKLPADSHVLVFCLQSVPEEDRPYHRTACYVRYDLRTADISMIASGHVSGNPETVYACFCDGQSVCLDSPIDYLEENLDGFDAFILIDRNSEFDEAVRTFLETYEGDTPVVFAYDLESQ